MTSGKPRLDLGVVDDHAVMGGERDLQAATERGAVDGRDDGDAQRLDAAQGGLDLADALGELGRVLVARLGSGR